MRRSRPADKRSSLPIPSALRKRHHTVIVLTEHITALYAPALFTTAFDRHILLQPDTGIRSVQTASIDGISTHVRLKRFIAAGHGVGAGAFAVLYGKTVLHKGDIAAYMSAGTLGFTKQLFQLKKSSVSSIREACSIMGEKTDILGVILV